MGDASDARVLLIEKTPSHMEKDSSETAEVGSSASSPTNSRCSVPKVHAVRANPEVSTVGAAVEDQVESFDEKGQRVEWASLPSSPSQSRPSAPSIRIVHTSAASAETTSARSLGDVVTDLSTDSRRMAGRASSPASPSDAQRSVPSVLVVNVAADVTRVRSPGRLISMDSKASPKMPANFNGAAGPPCDIGDAGGMHCDASASSGSVRKLTLSSSSSVPSLHRVGLGSTRVHSKVGQDGGPRCSPACSPAASRSGSPAPAPCKTEMVAVYCRSHMCTPAGSRAGSPAPAAVQFSGCKPEASEHSQHTVQHVRRWSVPRPPVLPTGQPGPARSPRWAFKQPEDSRGMFAKSAPLQMSSTTVPVQVVAVSGVPSLRLSRVGVAKASGPQASPIIHAWTPNDPQ